MKKIYLIEEKRDCAVWIDGAWITGITETEAKKRAREEGGRAVRMRGGGPL